MGRINIVTVPMAKSLAIKGAATSVFWAAGLLISLSGLFIVGPGFYGSGVFAANIAEAQPAPAAVVASSMATVSRRDPLAPGMNYSQVQARWGEPKEKIEYELLNKAVWKYPASKNSPAVTLQFSKGVLSSEETIGKRLLSSKSVNDRESKKLKDSASRDRLDNKRPESFMALSDQKMLSEILKEVPNEPEGEKAAASGRNPAVPAQIE